MGSLSVVVARYRESVAWLGGLEVDAGSVYLYNKGGLSDAGYVNIPLENVGRESHTYLHHIVTCWDSLTDYVVFCQGEPLYHCYFFLLAVNTFRGQSAYVSLAQRCEYCFPDGKPHEAGLDIGATYSMITGKEPPAGYVFHAGAQFLVSSELIKRRGLDWWVRVKEIHDSNPRMPWVFERLWSYILQDV